MENTVYAVHYHAADPGVEPYLVGIFNNYHLCLDVINELITNTWSKTTRPEVEFISHLKIKLNNGNLGAFEISNHRINHHVGHL